MEVALSTMPSHMWVGPHKIAVAQIVFMLKHQACAHGVCNQCATCVAIEQRQYHASMWLYPDIRYTLEQFEPVFEKLSFELNEGERFFIVIQKADALSHACANSLLKLLEEPPTGYYFFLTTERIDDLLPTIRSRCMMHTIVHDAQNVVHQDLFDFLTTVKGYDPVAFSQQLSQSNMNEREAMELADALLYFWMKQYKKGVMDQSTPRLRLTGQASSEPAGSAQDRIAQAEQVILILKEASNIFPMPGSSNLFLKDLYLQIKGLAV